MALRTKTTNYEGGLSCEFINNNSYIGFDGINDIKRETWDELLASCVNNTFETKYRILHIEDDRTFAILVNKSQLTIELSCNLKGKDTYSGFTLPVENCIAGITKLLSKIK